MQMWPTLFAWQNSRNPTKKKLSGISGYHGDKHEDIKVRIMFHTRALNEYLNLRNKTN